jgi:stalled ribosome rescue protein Dom34
MHMPGKVRRMRAWHGSRRLGDMHHSVVWLDHREAKIFDVTRTEFQAQHVQAPAHHVRKHPQVTHEREHPADKKTYYHDVAKALAGANDILIVGPSTAKLELVRHLQTHDPMVYQRVVGVETVDHPTEGQLVAYVRAYFQPPAMSH